MCADCTKDAPYEIRGIHKCAEHYIEALEYSAHITSFVVGDDHPIFVQMPYARKGLDKSPIY